MITTPQRKRGRPKKVINDETPYQAKDLKSKGKRGRPKKDKPKEEQTTYNSTPRQLKLSLAKTYLEMSGGEVSEDIKKKYFEKINEVPLEDFHGTGFSVYREILDDLKNDATRGNISEQESISDDTGKGS